LRPDSSDGGRPRKDREGSVSAISPCTRLVSIRVATRVS
jgi:hypothetical protein